MIWTRFVGSTLLLAVAVTAQTPVSGTVPEVIKNNISPQVTQETNASLPLARVKTRSLADSIPCIIITNQAMEAAFEPYAIFKTKHGSNTKIVTSESIATTYPGDSSQIKIRNCIRDYHETKHTLWVILGGDIDIIKPMYPRCMLTDVMSDLY
ncbi:MAG: C25 family cysteine peptidase [Candidatus Zixiibacteriota bacterium]